MRLKPWCLPKHTTTSMFLGAGTYFHLNQFKLEDDKSEKTAGWTIKEHISTKQMGAWRLTAIYQQCDHSPLGTPVAVAQQQDQIQLFNQQKSRCSRYFMSKMTVTISFFFLLVHKEPLYASHGLQTNNLAASRPYHSWGIYQNSHQPNNQGHLTGGLSS